MRPGCKKPEGSLSSRPESDPAASRVRTKSVSDGGWGLSSLRATDRACDEPVCLRCRWGRAHKSEMASDGEVVSGLNAPNWAGAMALRVCESASLRLRPGLTQRPARAWLPVPLDTGPFAGILESGGQTASGQWADALLPRCGAAGRCSCMKRMWPNTPTNHPHEVMKRSFLPGLRRAAWISATFLPCLPASCPYHHPASVSLKRNLGGWADDRRPWNLRGRRIAQNHWTRPRIVSGSLSRSDSTCMKHL